MQTIAPLWLWFVFVGIVGISLWVDFVWLKRKGVQAMGPGPTLLWAAIWFGLGVAFDVLLGWVAYGVSGSQDFALQKMLKFFTGFLIEKSLAIDNVLMFLMIFSYFWVPGRYTERVLMIGILVAIAARTLMIMAGSWMLSYFHWMIYVFGTFALLSGLFMLFSATRRPNLGKNPMLRLLRFALVVSPRYDGEKFWTLQDGVRKATPLLLVLCMVLATNIIFAVNSIPAIFSITHDPFVILSSNVFAVLGLRCLYFSLRALVGKFRYLTQGLALILILIGAKMCLLDYVGISVHVILAEVVVIMAIALLLGFYHAKPKSAWPPETLS